VIKREIPAWYFRITALADELLAGLDQIDWPERIKSMQRNWIGRSEGCEIIFAAPSGKTLPVFTTRPDTVYGVTFLAIAPEHPLVENLAPPEYWPAVQAYQAQAARQSEIERMMETRQKTGVFSGSYAVHPLTGARVPIWVADYVLPGYGTGVVMGVPAHDTRDFEFARQYGLPVIEVIAPASTDLLETQAAYTGSGRMVNSAEFDGLDSVEGARRIAAALQARRAGGPKVIYRMRDWLISRQRYWGTPIPIVYCDVHGEQPVPSEQLPVLLPAMENFQPDGSGRSPLARLPEFLHTTCPLCGGPARRETDTLGGFACSSWYFLRYASPWSEQEPFERQAADYWLPVDLYVGGAEHAVLHLLYARFWTRVLADAGLISFREPFAKLLNQGQLLAPDGARMSKSRGNVITPDRVVEAYGADALRVYELFMAPFDQDIAWSTAGIHGAVRFLSRIWALYADAFTAGQAASGTDPELERWLHKTIRQASERIEGFRFNTLVSALMEFVNLLAQRRREGDWQTETYQRCLETLLLLLAPVAPFIADELWVRTGHSGSVHAQYWPVWDAELAAEETQEVAIQINGRVRATIPVQPGASAEAVQQIALAHPKVAAWLAGQSVK
jgi:leucyl-tRNA synthetase